jgi:hypothetical protein
LKTLSSAIGDLHAALINDAKADYFKDSPEKVVSPLELLKIISDDSHFKWLRALLNFLSRLDEARLGKDSIEAKDLSAFRDSLEKLTGPASAENIDFRQRYVAALQQAPSVSM